ncbi:MAG: sulfotransferase [Rhodothermales bacterium]|nr:sulfotransferase [Rhodothermales bacterium]
MVQWREQFGMAVEPEGVRFQSPVFVIGCMRSGTTFLADKLSEHPQLLKIGNELRDVWTTLGNAPCSEDENFRRSADDFDPVVAANMAAYFSRYATISRSATRHLMRLSYRLRKRRGRVFYDWDNLVPLNKSTRLINKIGYVHSLFPNSKIVLIVRGLGGQSASMKVFVDRMQHVTKSTFAMSSNPGSAWAQVQTADSGPDKFVTAYPPDFRAIPEMWVRLNLMALLDLQKLPSENYRVVRYEDLVTKPSEYVKALFDFLDLEEAHVEKAKSISNSPTSITNAVSDGNLLTWWESALNNDEREVIEHVKHSIAYAKIEQILDKIAITV